jgi:hypothetical protein
METKDIQLEERNLNCGLTEQQEVAETGASQAWLEAELVDREPLSLFHSFIFVPTFLHTPCHSLALPLPHLTSSIFNRFILLFWNTGFFLSLLFTITLRGLRRNLDLNVPNPV